MRSVTDAGCVEIEPQDVGRGGVGVSGRWWTPFDRAQDDAIDGRHIQYSMYRTDLAAQWMDASNKLRGVVVEIDDAVAAVVVEPRPVALRRSVTHEGEDVRDRRLVLWSHHHGSWLQRVPSSLSSVSPRHGS